MNEELLSTSLVDIDMNFDLEKEAIQSYASRKKHKKTNFIQTIFFGNTEIEKDEQSKFFELNVDEDDEGELLINEGYMKRMCKVDEEKLGWFMGVFVPVCLDCFGVILFLRMAMIVGNAGIIVSIVIFMMGYVLCILTVSSASAIATNGIMKAGGVYYMISRILGGLYGGSLGVILFLANIAGTALYCIGFVDALLHAFPSLESIGSLDLYYSRVLIGSILLFFAMIICCVGAQLFSKTSFFIFLVLLFSIGTTIISFSFLDLPLFSYVDIEKIGYLGLNWKTFMSNLFPYRPENNKVLDVFYSDCSNIMMNNSCKCNVSMYENFANPNDWGKDVETGEQLNFGAIFGIFFPAVTGILAGTNLSGDLKDPSKAIPKGTLFGTVFTFVIYVVVIFIIGGSTERIFLVEDYSIIQEISFFSWFVTIGIFAATTSSVLTSLIGASRILLALSKDNLLPGLGLFSFEFGKSKNPIFAVLCSWLLVQLTLFLGHLGTIAPIVTMFFIFTMAMINLSTLMLSITNPPNFRPAFKMYSWYISLIGFIFCIIIMFWIDWLNAFLCTIFNFVLMLIVWGYTRKRNKKWGSIGHAFFDCLSKNFQFNLQHTEESHVKYWNFNSLILVSNPRSQYKFIDFFDNLVNSRRGACFSGHVILGEKFKNHIESVNENEAAFNELIKESKWKMFYTVIFSKSIREGCFNLIKSCGLGSMTPQYIVLGWLDSEHNAFESEIDYQGRMKIEALNKFEPVNAEVKHSISLSDYICLIKDILRVEKSVIIGRNFHNLKKELLVPVKKYGKALQVKTIDVWILMLSHSQVMMEPTISLLLQLSILLKFGSVEWKKYHKIRIMALLRFNEDEKHAGKTKMYLENLLSRARIKAEIVIIKVEQGDIPSKLFNNNNDVDIPIENTDDVEEENDENIQKSESISFLHGGVSKSKSFSFKRSKDSLSFDNLSLCFKGEISQLVLNDGKVISLTQEMKIINNIIYRNSENTSIIFLNLPPPPIMNDQDKDDIYSEYYDIVKSLSDGNIPTVMVYSNKNVLSYYI